MISPNTPLEAGRATQWMGGLQSYGVSDADPTPEPTGSGPSRIPNQEPTPTRPVILADTVDTSSPDLAGFYASNPAYAQEYANTVGRGDRRTPLEWFAAFLNLSPQDQVKYQDYQTSQDFTGGLLSGGGAGSPINPDTSVPSSVTDFFDNATKLDSGTDLGSGSNSGGSDIFGQLKGLLDSFFASFGRPSSNVTVAPVTTTNVTENVAVDNSTHLTDTSSHVVNNNATGWDFNQVIELVNRLTGINSVPAGGNAITSPSSPTVGYGQNVDQSAPRLGGQTIASVAGLELNTAGVGVGGFGIPWRTLIIGAILSVVAFVIYKRYFSR